MTWQAISERPAHRPGDWPHEALIQSFREKVEAGTYWMAHRHVGDKVQLVVKKRRVPGRPCRYWSAPSMSQDRVG